MRRGRLVIYLVLIVVAVVIFAVLYFLLRGGLGGAQSDATPTPEIRYVDIVTAAQYIYPGTPITEEMLGTMQIPEGTYIEGVFTDKLSVVGQYAQYPIAQGIPITTAMVSLTPGDVNLPGSAWSPFIPQGLTAISVPITRLSSVAYGIRDGDYVNVLVTLLVVDVDSAYQTATPNTTAVVSGAAYPLEGPPMLTIGVSPTGPYGRAELVDQLQEVVYIIPSETQRPRLVSQLIMQRVQVLHVGTFPLPGEPTSELLMAPEPGTEPTAASQPAEGEEPVQVVRPDLITLMVAPQDAVTLNYLIFSGAQITLTLRNPNDVDLYPATNSATLEYLMSQYNISIPAKVPYAVEPRIDQLIQPYLPNDSTYVQPSE
ncbi:MAG: hypothetical protein JXB85_07030 [Anaerolineales bacterium]|nr:hypothetical protein [Anaerolineales bacterium]